MVSTTRRRSPFAALGIAVTLLLAACGDDGGGSGLSLDGDAAGSDGGDTSGVEIPVFDVAGAADPSAPAGLQPGTPVELGQTAEFELFSVTVNEIGPGGPVEGDTLFTGPDSITLSVELTSTTDTAFAPTNFVTACADDLGAQAEPELFELQPGATVEATAVVTIAERCLGQDVVLRLPNQLPQLQVAEWEIPSEALG